VVIPMHYWSAKEKADFLDQLRARSGRYELLDRHGPDWDVEVPDSSAATQVISLEPGPAGEGAAADVEAIRTLLHRWTSLYNAEKFEAIMSDFYSERAVLLAPGHLAHDGRPAILRSFVDDARVNLEHVDSTVVEEVRVSGDLAVARGTDTGSTTPRAGGPPEKYSLKWVIAFERQPDRYWKCVYEMWNDNPPPGTPSGAR